MAIGAGRSGADQPDDQRAGCWKKGAQVFGALIALVFVTHFIFGKAIPPAANEKTPQAAAEEKLSKQQSMAVTVAIQWVRESLRNPASVEWVKVSASSDGSAVCITLRAQNAFGAITEGSYSMHHYKLSRSASQWNKYCAGASLDDLTEAVKLLYR